MRSYGFIGVRVELAGDCVALDRSIEPPRVEFLEPGTKPRQLVGRELLDGFRHVLCGRHARSIALCVQDEKRWRGARLLSAATRMCYF